MTDRVAELAQAVTTLEERVRMLAANLELIENARRRDQQRLNALEALLDVPTRDDPGLEAQIPGGSSDTASDGPEGPTSE